MISDIRTNIREWSRFTETDKRKLAFFSIKNRCPAFRRNNGEKIQKDWLVRWIFLAVDIDIDFDYDFSFWLFAVSCWLLAFLTMTLTIDRKSQTQSPTKQPVQTCENPSRNFTIQKSIVKLRCGFDWRSGRCGKLKKTLTKDGCCCIFAGRKSM